MIRQIIKWPNRVLKTPSLPVVHEDLHVLPKLIADMRETMLASKGVGLSAIQVGVPLQVVVTAFPGLETLVNPRWTPLEDDKDLVSEGCLSLPGIYEQVRRYSSVVVSFQNQDLVPMESRILYGMAAQCVQHEQEHIVGHFFLDHISAGRRDQIRASLRKGRR